MTIDFNNNITILIVRYNIQSEYTISNFFSFGWFENRRAKITLPLIIK